MRQEEWTSWESGARRAPWRLAWAIGAAILALTGGSGPVAADADSEVPAMPQLVWNEGDGQLIATVPPAVRAWRNGDLDDPDGRLASWYDRYDLQRQQAAFGRALFELQRLVTAKVSETGMTPFEVENELLPALLRERNDLARGLVGEPFSAPNANPTCYRVESGMEYCGHSGLSCCFSDFFCCCSYQCNTNAAGGCSVTTPIECPQQPLTGVRR